MYVPIWSNGFIILSCFLIIGCDLVGSELGVPMGSHEKIRKKSKTKLSFNIIPSINMALPPQIFRPSYAKFSNNNMVLMCNISHLHIDLVLVLQKSLQIL